MRQLRLFSPNPEVPFVDPFQAACRPMLDTARDDRILYEGFECATRDVVGMDVESFENFFLVCFKRFADGARASFEMSQQSSIDKEALRHLLVIARLVTFNGRAYDVPMVLLALRGADTHKLKQASNKIIKESMRPWAVEKEFDLNPPKLDHIDLMEPNPAVRQGLKMLNARLHGRYVVDLPYDPEATLTRRQMNYVMLYCMNDLDATHTLFEAMKEPLELRRQLSNQYHHDLRSSSDAQVGEFIVKNRAGVIGAGNASADHSSSFSYDVPPFIDFRTETMRRVLGIVRAARFYVGGAGKVEMPPSLEGLKVTVGGSTYSLGIGGLHSNEAHRAIHAGDGLLIDFDVASQYPNIILKLGLYPKRIGPKFKKVYRALTLERLAAKAAGDKLRADSGRIAVNGVYGKLGSSYSALYAPEIMLATTLTGQLSILMLIERFEGAGISVVSANTDGVVIHAPKQKEAEIEAIVAGWEGDTGMKVERTPYSSIYNSSVNTYVAVKADGKVKRKGTIADPWGEGDLRGQMSKNPQMTICGKAIVDLVTKGAPLPNTVSACKDPRMFVTVIHVNGGAVWRGHRLGRVARYYWSLDGDPIMYSSGNRRVAKTEGARPMIEMTDELPPDIDLDRYVDEAKRLAIDLGIRLQ